MNPLVINFYVTALDLEIKFGGVIHLASVLTILKYERILTQALRLVSCVPLLSKAKTRTELGHQIRVCQDLSLHLSDIFKGEQCPS